MADNLLSEALFGGPPSAPVRLSWSDQQTLERAAAGAMASAVELRQLRNEVRHVEQGQAWLGAWMASAVAALERDLGLRLDQQTGVLLQQRELLASIDEALRTPAKTRAAERIADTGELLRRGRYDRALANAQEAVDDDPNNPAGFRALAWALCGLRRLDDAREAFAECAAASDGDERAEALRQSARLAYLLDSPSAALTTLAAVDDQIGDEESRAVHYDRAVYLAEAGEQAAAADELSQAYRGDSRFAFQAFGDQVLKRHPGLLDGVAAYIDHLIEQMREDLERTQSRLAAADGAIVALADEVEARRGQLLAVRERLAADVAELRRRRAALDADAETVADADDDVPVAGEPLPVADVRERLRRAQQLAQAAEALVAARSERDAAVVAAAEQEQAERERTQERRRVLDAAIEKTVAKAGRRCQVYRSALEFKATIKASGLLRSSTWEISVDETLRVWVIEQR